MACYNVIQLEVSGRKWVFLTHFLFYEWSFIYPMAKKKSFSVDYNRIEQLIWHLAEPVTAEVGCELVDVQYVKEGSTWYLRLFIDREPPIDHNCCQAVSERISDILDKVDPIEQSYYLEVSSPGVERPLRKDEDFARFAGHEIVVKLYAPLDGSKQYQGCLVGLEQGQIIIEQEGKRLAFAKETVAAAHLAADF